MIRAFMQKYIIYALVAIMMFWCATAGYYRLRCGNLENKAEALTQERDTARSANDESQKSITELKNERTKAAKSCQSRIQGYDETLAELIRLDSLTGGNHDEATGITGGNSTADNHGVSDSSGDAVLDELNRVYPVQAGSPNGVCEAGDPGDAEGSGALPGAVRRYVFCTDRDAVNFLKNHALDRGYEKQFVTILEGLR